MTANRWFLEISVEPAFVIGRSTVFRIGNLHQALLSKAGQIRKKLGKYLGCRLRGSSRDRCAVEDYRAPLTIHFDCKRLQSILAALKDQNASSMVNSTTSGHFDLPPCQNRFRSFSSEKQLLEAPHRLPLRLLVGATAYPLNRVLEQLGSISQIQLVLDMCSVGFDSLYTQVQSLGYLTSPMTLADQTKHLQLTVA